jgi:hypothetical protein
MKRWVPGALVVALTTPVAAEPLEVVLRPYMAISALEFDLGGDEGTTYSPNSPMKLGLAASYRGFGASASLAVDTLESEASHGATSALDLSFYWYGERWGWDLFFQRYAGLHYWPAGEVEADDGPPSLAPGATARRFGATAYFALDPAFSPAVVFAQRRRPEASVGSWVLLGSLEHGDFGLSGAPEVRLQGATVGGGWAQIWISEAGWYAAPLIMVGLGAGAPHSEGALAGLAGGDDLRGMLKANIKLSMGNHGPRFYWGLTALADSFALLDDGDGAMEWRSLNVEWFLGFRL